MKIGTHDGRFHADEALACFLLRLLPRYENAQIVRTRDPKILDRLDIVVDVGGVYDLETSRFDHHQRGFEETFSSQFHTKLSSAGLVYKHFGREILASHTGEPEDGQLVSAVFEQLYIDLIEEFDAVDNGISAYPDEIAPRFKVGATSIYSRIFRLNPRWNEENVNVQNRFLLAMDMAGQEFVDTVEYLCKSWWLSKSIVEKCFATRFSVHPSGKLVVLDKICPWEDHLFQLEDGKKEVLYILYEDNLHNQWMVRAVPVFPKSFLSRHPLPELWRGLRGPDLDAQAGMNGCVFVHSTGFLGSHNSRLGAICMAEKALNTV